jgi:hypothetical protein
LDEYLLLLIKIVTHWGNEHAHSVQWYVSQHNRKEEGGKWQYWKGGKRIKRQSADGQEYWSARDLADVLGYTQWCNFE